MCQSPSNSPRNLRSFTQTASTLQSKSKFEVLVIIPWLGRPFSAASSSSVSPPHQWICLKEAPGDHSLEIHRVRMSRVAFVCFRHIFVCACVCYLHVRNHKQVGDFSSVIDETVPVQQINGSTRTKEKHGQTNTHTHTHLCVLQGPGKSV